MATILAAFNFFFYMLFPMPGFRRWDGLMTATTIAHFGDTPWQVILFFAHTLVIPITQFFNLIFGNADPLLVTSLREVFFSTINIVLIYYFFRNFLKSDFAAIMIGVVYIFCFSHWQFTTGGEEKDTMLVLNIIYLIGFFGLKGWISFGFVPRLKLFAARYSNWFGHHLPDLALGFILAFSIMIHLENGILVITTGIVYLIRKDFYLNFKKQIAEFLIIMLTAGILLLIWFGILIIGVNGITTIAGGLRWLLEYHATGEFFNANIVFTDQLVWAYEGFRRFLIGKYFEHDYLWIEVIVVVSIFIYLVVKSYKYSPEIIWMALIYIGVVSAHFFFWIPWDPEQWNPVAFAGFIVITPALFTYNQYLKRISGIFVVLLILINCYTYSNLVDRYQKPYQDNKRLNAEYVGGLSGFYVRNLPYSNMAQLTNKFTEPGALILVDHRHLANHLMIYTDLEPIVTQYLDRPDEMLRDDLYLSHLSVHFYKPQISNFELIERITSGNSVYCLSNSERKINTSIGHLLKFDILHNFYFRGYKLSRVTLGNN